MNKFSIGSGFSSKEVDSFINSQHTEQFDISSTNEKSSSDQIVDDNGTIYILDSVGDVKESSKPTVKGQFKKNNLWRYGTPKAVILHLSKEEDLKTYNKILAGASGEDPSHYIIESARQFWEGQFIVMLTWCPVLYASLMRKTK